MNKILWADDEIDLLKPHILFLNSKGYDVTTANNGIDAIKSIKQHNDFDLVILDENMPGISGLDTLSIIKECAPQMPIIMITKSEEENIMDKAIGSKISDYLIKPVNPRQILLSIKKLLHSSELVTSHSTDEYRQDFSKITSLINESYSLSDWKSLYRKIVYWELELSLASTNMDQMLELQKNEANSTFAKFIKRNYSNLIDSNDELMSHNLMNNIVFPLIDSGDKAFFILIDNFRFDQWCIIRQTLSEYFNYDENICCSILPTATQYSRNAIFSGLMPNQIARIYPDLWIEENEEESKNSNEETFIREYLSRTKRNIKFSYNKINDNTAGERLIQNISSLSNNELNVIIFNFIDMMSHARTESRMMRELASTNAAYRSITESWFKHSSALELFKTLANKNYKIVLTSDHGTIKVENAVKIVGDRNTNTNLRYKVGKNLNHNSKQVYEINRPADFGLPSPNVSSTYVFATNRDFFAYPNNYNHYVQYYTDTFQHGGISLEEMLVPAIVLTPKK